MLGTFSIYLNRRVFVMGTSEFGVPDQPEHPYSSLDILITPYLFLIFYVNGMDAHVCQ